MGRMMMTAKQGSHRARWAANRRVLEKKPVKKGVFEGHGIKVDTLSRMAFARLKRTRVYARGFKNAAFPRLVHCRLYFRTLPEAFDGYTILHLTDLHLGNVPGLAERTAVLIGELSRERPIHACLMTGDYVDRHRRTDPAAIMAPMKRILSSMTPVDGVFAVLGNHDTWKMVPALEALGIRMLINESATIERGEASITLIGLDDPNHFYTPEAVRALEEESAGFRIAMVHTPELYEEAARNGVDLYLTGHTHAGQISLPGGRPVILPLKKGRQFYRGGWRYRNMTGYTGQGLGTISVPIRFNTFSEVTLIELRRGQTPLKP